MIGALPVFHGALADAGGFLHPHPPACFSTCGWLVWPQLYEDSYYTGDPWRIRKMCTNAVIYPCAHHDGTRWVNDGAEYVARWDSMGPTMGGVRPFPGSEKSRGTAPENYPTHNVPAQWPWVDTRNACWDFSVPYWFTPGSFSDWNFSTYAEALFDLIVTSPDGRRSRGPSRHRVIQCSALDADCFRCHVPAGSEVSIAAICEVFKRQNKATKAYESAVTNMWVHLVVSFCSPLPRCAG